MLLKNKVAIITGGAKGMGQAMSIKFAQEGAAVAVVDISATDLEQTVKEIEACGGKAISINCDVTRLEQVKTTVQKTLDTFGKIDILVNNAGGHPTTPPIEDMTEAEWDETLNLNLKSVFFFCKFVVPYMKAQKSGKIVSISSIGAVHPPAHVIHYNTAKSAIIGFTYDLARTLAPFNINVNAILPGPVRTHFYDKTTSKMTDEEKAGFFQRLGLKTPLRRIGEPEDLANAVVFLASEMSSFITAEILHVTGGIPQEPQPL